MDDMTSVQRRAQGYWFVDGLPEIAGGIASALVGGLLFAAKVSGIEWLSTVALLTLIIAFPVSAAVVKALKERVTYPRTGFVSYASPSRSRRFVAAAVGFLVAGVLVPLSRMAEGGEVSVAVIAFGAAAGGITALRAWRTGSPRFYVVAAALVTASALLGTSGAGIEDGIGLMLVFYGATLVVTGTWTLVHYLRANQVPEGGAA